jgi:hypothetical protein
MEVDGPIDERPLARIFLASTVSEARRVEAVLDGDRARSRDERAE